MSIEIAYLKSGYTFSGPFERARHEHEHRRMLRFIRTTSSRICSVVNKALADDDSRARCCYQGLPTDRLRDVQIAIMSGMFWIPNIE